MIRSIRAIEASDVCILMLDGTRGIETQDVNIFLYHPEELKGRCGSCNKWDLVEDKSTAAIKHYGGADSRAFRAVYRLPHHLHLGYNQTAHLQGARRGRRGVAENRRRTVPTSQLNTVMQEDIAAYPPPSNKGKFIKIKYITMLKGATVPTLLSSATCPNG